MKYFNDDEAIQWVARVIVEKAVGNVTELQNLSALWTDDLRPGRPGWSPYLKREVSFLAGQVLRLMDGER